MPCFPPWTKRWWAIGCQLDAPRWWHVPVGADLPEGMDAQKLLPLAVERGMAFVPGAPFFPGNPQHNCLRLWSVTVRTQHRLPGIAALAAAIKAYAQ